MKILSIVFSIVEIVFYITVIVWILKNWKRGKNCEYTKNQNK